MSVAKEGRYGGEGLQLVREGCRIYGVWAANHDLQSAENHGKTYANQCKSMQIRLQIKMSFPSLCKARANHDLHLDLQLANHDLQSANHT